MTTQAAPSKDQIQCQVAAHNSFIKHGQAVEATGIYLEALKKHSPDQYSNCELVITSSNDPKNGTSSFRIEENGNPKFTITHNPQTGIVTANFHNTDPKYLELAFYYAKKCEIARAQLEGTQIGMPHPLQSKQMQIIVGPDAKQEDILAIYEKARISKMKVEEIEPLISPEFQEKYKALQQLPEQELFNKQEAAREEVLMKLDKTASAEMGGKLKVMGQF